jgi:type II secretory ATPase GspE/PulE/Tfp pilus assembly ATPase PilB-like protein
MSKIGDILIKKGIITLKELNIALEEQRRTKEPIGEVFVRLGFVKEDEFLEVLAQQLGMEFYPQLANIEISEEVIKKIPIRLVWHYKFIPIKLEDNILTVAIFDPFNPWLTEGIKTDLNYKVKRVLAPEKEILESIKKYYGVAAETVEEILKDASKQKQPIVERRATPVEDIEKSVEDASVIKLVNQILSEAIKNRATDIHLEPYRDSVRLRQRIDGVLYNIGIPPQIKYLYSAIISRIKIISGLDVVERRLPQDGRAKVKIKDKEIDLRISVLPSAYGENIVIRILPTQLLLNLSDLGFLPEDLEELRKIIKKPHGIIFLTGPTGSGKTTTLYASLSEINSTAVKIITIEDPVEYELENITQIQVNPKIGLSFASALRSILRHDPDVMMVGEVRDPETAELAIRSSLTGHVVFSTLHTNDAASGVARLLDMGIEPYLAASSIEVMISQRLVRVICPKCKTQVSASKYKIGNYNLGKYLYEGKGCESCGSTGFYGRTVIYEMLIMNDEIRDLVLQKASSSQIKKKALELGLKTLRENGLEKVKQGVTTLDEVMRVVELE